VSVLSRGAEVGFLLESVRLLAGEGDLVLGTSGRARLEAVRPVFRRVADREGVPQAFLEAIAWTESSFRVEAVGPKIGSGDDRAHGLMQIASFNFSALVRDGVWTDPDHDWRDPERNILAGAWDLRGKGLGDDDVGDVLKRYGGFVTADPSQYIRRILTRSTWLWVDRIATETGLA